MRETTPKVWLIASPSLHLDAIEDYLESVDGGDWLTRVVAGPSSSAEQLIEFGGRLCYRSWKPGLNANVKKVRTESDEYLENILRSKHGSVLEHASFSFVFQDVSRVFTHELVRHRAGVAVSQESLRYVRLTDLGFRIPDVLESQRKQIVTIIERLEEFQVETADALGLDDEGVPFHVKKEVTSALRRLAPLGLSTSVLWTANIRTIRHVLDMRTAPGAEEEIRYVFNLVGETMLDECPLLFQDFDRVIVPRFDEQNEYAGEDPVPWWQLKYEKV
jgi:thymidylate synthase (FAD)